MSTEKINITIPICDIEITLTDRDPLIVELEEKIMLLMEHLSHDLTKPWARDPRALDRIRQIAQEEFARAARPVIAIEVQPGLDTERGEIDVLVTLPPKTIRGNE